MKVCYMGMITDTKTTNRELQIKEALAHNPEVEPVMVTFKPPGHYGEMAKHFTRFSDERLEGIVEKHVLESMPLGLVQLPSTLIDVNPDILELNGQGSASLLAVLLANGLGIKTVANLLGSELLRPDPKTKRCVNAILSRADAVVSLAEFTRSLISHKEKLYVISPGVDTEEFQPRDSIKKENVVLYTGVYEPYKNHAQLIQAMKEVKSKAILWFVQQLERNPKQEYHNKLLANALGLGERVKYLRPLKHSLMPKLYNKVSVYAHPSLTEMFPRSVVEAMSSGLPVVANSIPATRELIDHGANGLLYETTEELSGFIDELLASKSERDRLGDNARRMVLGEHTVKQAAVKRKRLYEGLLG